MKSIVEIESYDKRGNRSAAFMGCFSLLIFFFVLAPFAIVGASFSVGLYNGTVSPDSRSESAGKNAVAFVKEMGWDVTRVACSGMDSDFDSYVTCTLGSPDGRVRSIECPYELKIQPWGANHVCKLQNTVNLQTGN